MIATTDLSRRAQGCSEPDTEYAIVTRLMRTATDAGLRANPIAVINFYVALKSKPLTILAGPEQSGKIALIWSLAQVLTGGNRLQCQMMVGHAWWAERSSDVSFGARTQTRFNTEKIFALIEEALQPANSQRVYLACLTHISPAEFTGYFSEVAFQLRHGELMRLPGHHLTEPIPYPPNLLIVGTMDTSRPGWPDADLHSQTTVIRWPAIETESTGRNSQAQALPGSEREFLRSCIRSEQAARLKLHRILGWWPQSSPPFIEIECLLRKHSVALPDAVRDEVLIYLANAWTRNGRGLFDSAHPHNMTMALDLAMGQIILPRLSATIRHSATLRKQLGEALDGRFPCSAELLNSLT